MDVAWLRENATRPVRVSVRISWPGGAAELARAVGEVRAHSGAEPVVVWLGSDSGAQGQLSVRISAMI